MSEEDKNKSESDDKGNQEDVGKAAKSTTTANDDAKKDHIPYDRFKEVNEKLKTALERLSELENAKAERDAEAKRAEEDQLKVKGEFEKLAAQKSTELESANVNLSKAIELIGTFRKTFTESIKDALKSLPDEIKALYPYGSDPSDDDLIKAREWILKAEATVKSKVETGGSVKSPDPAGTGTKIQEKTLEETKSRYRRW